MTRPQSRPHDAPSYCGLIVSALVLMLLCAAFWSIYQMAVGGGWLS